MRKSLQGIVFAGLMTVGFTTISAPAGAQHKYDFGNPDIPYIEQRGFSLGCTLGQTDLWGDVGTKSVLDHYMNPGYTGDVFGNMRFMGSLFLRYTHVPGISFRWGVGFGSLYATDRWNEDKAMKAKFIADDSYQRYLRNLDAKTNIWESSLIFEFSPFRVSNWEFGSLTKSRIQPYLLLGVAGFYFNPKGTNVNLETGIEKEIRLQPLRTEGQNFTSPSSVFPKTYSLFSYAGVGGIGLKFDIGKALCLGLEYQLRYTFTDYLDDVSGTYIDPLDHEVAFLGQSGKAAMAQKMADRSNEIIPGYKHTPGSFRGDPNNKDMYSSVSIMFFWKINKRASPWWSTY